LISLRNNIHKSLANIDVLLKQRYDEIPNLVEVVKAYIKHEKKLFENIAKARSAMANANNLSQKAAASDAISTTLKNLFALAEDYPKLRAVENFMQLQERISTLENQIADRREYYNDSVNLYNTRIESVPDIIVAATLKYKREEFFKATEEDKKNVELSFKEKK
jgi:LemA protein